jgi:hypothetical protein
MVPVLVGTPGRWELDKNGVCFWEIVPLAEQRLFELAH